MKLIRQRQQVEQRSITDMEVPHAVLNTKLKRRSYFYLRAIDAPAVAGEYVDAPLLLRMSPNPPHRADCKSWRCGHSWRP